MRIRRYQLLVAVLQALLALLLLWHLLPLRLSSGPANVPAVPIGEMALREYAGDDYALYLPSTAAIDGPVTLLIAFFPMGGNARGFATSLTQVAEEQGWLLLVPGFDYGDWRQIEAVRGDDRKQLPWLRSLLDVLPEETGLQIRSRALLYGFSRGAQAAHRFALMYHDRVLAVATLGAGTYTLPVAALPRSEGSEPLPYPTGVHDLASYCGEPFEPEGVRTVAFWVGVGARDNNPAEVPRLWDSFEGTNRVERATAFARWMASIGAQVELEVIPGVGHQETAETRARAVSFLKRMELE